MFASLAVYVIVQFFDVWLYHKWWAFTDKLFENHDKYLWVRNNGSTILSQFLNSLLFNVFAFYGTYDNITIWNIIVSSFVIFLITSLADTPFVYICRHLYRKKQTKLD